MDIKIQLENLIQEAQLLDGSSFQVNSNKGNDLLRLFDKSKNLLNLLKEYYPAMFEDIQIDENFSKGERLTKGDYYADTRIKQLLITLNACLKIINKITTKNELSSEQPLNILEKIARNFPIAVRQLKNRRSNKPSFEIADEYDVQDIFECFLYLFFDDIRKENSSPEFAGSNSKIDFVLPKEQIGIEIKKTRQGLDSKKLGEELLIDKGRYKKHPDCKFLFCFVYDNEHKINNPIGIENDLSDNSDPDFGIRVKIFPK